MQERAGLASWKGEEDSDSGAGRVKVDAGGGCLWCGKALPLLSRLKGERFCCEAHERAHARQQAEQFLERVRKYRRQGGGSRLRSETSKIIIRPGKQQQAAPGAFDELPAPHAPGDWKETGFGRAPTVSAGEGWRAGSLPRSGRFPDPALMRAWRALPQAVAGAWFDCWDARPVQPPAGEGLLPAMRKPGGLEFTPGRSYDASRRIRAMQESSRLDEWLPLSHGLVFAWAGLQSHSHTQPGIKQPEAMCPGAVAPAQPERGSAEPGAGEWREPVAFGPGAESLQAPPVPSLVKQPLPGFARAWRDPGRMGAGGEGCASARFQPEAGVGAGQVLETMQAVRERSQHWRSQPARPSREDVSGREPGSADALKSGSWLFRSGASAAAAAVPAAGIGPGLSGQETAFWRPARRSELGRPAPRAGLASVSECGASTPELASLHWKEGQLPPCAHECLGVAGGVPTAAPCGPILSSRRRPGISARIRARLDGLAGRRLLVVGARAPEACAATVHAGAGQWREPQISGHRTALAQSMLSPAVARPSMPSREALAGAWMAARRRTGPGEGAGHRADATGVIAQRGSLARWQVPAGDQAGWIRSGHLRPLTSPPADWERAAAARGWLWPSAPLLNRLRADGSTRTGESPGRRAEWLRLPVQAGSVGWVASVGALPRVRTFPPAGWTESGEWVHSIQAPAGPKWQALAARGSRRAPAVRVAEWQTPATSGATAGILRGSEWLSPGADSRSCAMPAAGWGGRLLRGRKPAFFKGLGLSAMASETGIRRLERLRLPLLVCRLPQPVRLKGTESGAEGVPLFQFKRQGL